ncbi:MAG: sarcosine oxidase subunit gamma [Albidovulum sp.]|nr:sarcosine oxidase subunit gamma [Albidovulum sp.]
MADPVLTPEPFLGGYAKKFKNAVLSEATGLSIVFVAEPPDGREELELALFEKFGLNLPRPGSSNLSANRVARIVWLAIGQYLILFEDCKGPAAHRVSAELQDTAYVGDQSDNWVALRLSGAAAEAALERICPVDVAKCAFPVGGVARTAMEHLGAIAIRESNDGFLLLSSSSSARSFLHAVQTSLNNVH